MADYLELAIEASEAAAELLRENFGSELNVDAIEAHDIKLELDVRSQELITEKILKAFPDHAIYGEEGMAGNQESEFQWIVDPIDGTVNYFYGIPHFAISIALRRGEEMIAGVIHDPILREVWTVEEGGPARLDGREISVSARDDPAQAMVTVGFAKTKESLEKGMARFGEIARQVRKVRTLGSAALGLAYISCGRLDAYIEEQISLWDIAAGKMLVEQAGGIVRLTPHAEGGDKFSIVATNGKLEF